MRGKLPEIDADRSEIVLGELVLGELHEDRGFADPGAPDEDEFDQLIILLNHNPNLSTIIIYQSFCFIFPFQLLLNFQLSSFTLFPIESIRLIYLNGIEIVLIIRENSQKNKLFLFLLIGHFFL